MRRAALGAGIPWRSSGFGLLHLALTASVVFLHRQAPFLVIAFSVAMLLWTGAAFLVAGMAIADDWM